MTLISLGRRRPVLSAGTGFWVVAAGFLVMMAFCTVPTPLYSLYQAREGFQTFTVTVIFAAYAVGVILALVFGGHLSDQVGRRKMLVIAAAVEAFSAVLFLLSGAVVILILARFVSGLAVGLLAAAATAGLSELRRVHTGSVGMAPTVATVANLGGLALGNVIGGMFAEWAPLPLATPYVAFLVALILLVVLLAFVPETASSPAGSVRYRPRGISVPGEHRLDYWMAGAGAFAAFAVPGFYGSVAPAFLVQVGGVTDHLVIGLVAFGVFGAAVAAQIATARTPLRSQIAVGATAMLVGMAVFAVSALVPSIPLFIAGGAIGGAGMGLVFRSVLAVSGSLAHGANRSEVLAGTFLMAYAGMTVPPLLIGTALLWWPIVPVLVIFAGLVFALVAWSGTELLRRV